MAAPKMNQARDAIAGLMVMHPFPGMVAGIEAG
jgi:hypothetical protein